MMSTMSTSVGHLLSDASVDILAHQGGWDEMAMLGGPALVIVVLGYLARRGIGGDDGRPRRHRSTQVSTRLLIFVFSEHTFGLCETPRRR